MLFKKKERIYYLIIDILINTALKKSLNHNIWENVAPKRGKYGVRHSHKPEFSFWKADTFRKNLS